MITTTERKVFRIRLIDHCDYMYRLIVTSDGLYILSPENKISETIVYGSDESGLLLGSNDIDEFLDGISTIKAMLSCGLNPVEHFPA